MESQFIRKVGLIGMVVASVLLVIANLMNDIPFGIAAGCSFILSICYVRWADKIAHWCNLVIKWKAA